MDLGDLRDDDFDIGTNRPRVLPPDLPTSLDDRRRTPLLNTEAEVYDAWQGGMTSAKPSSSPSFSPATFTIIIPFNTPPTRHCCE